MKRRLSRIVPAPISFCLVLGAAAESLSAEASFAQVDALFTEFAETPDQPGGAVGIVRDGELVYSRALGMAHLEHGVPNTTSTRFEIMSASKAFTSACIALLMDQGKIYPEDDIRKFLPELHAFDPPVRIRHMLRCESGLWASVHIMPLAGWENLPRSGTYLKQDLLAVLSGQQTLPFQPGADFQYSSSDFFLLGLVVERVSGQTLAEFAKAHLFGPLGMRDTYFQEDPGRVVKQRAVGHYRDRFRWSSDVVGDAEAWRLWTNQGYWTGGAGVHTTVMDMVCWDRAFRSGNHALPQGEHMDEFLSTGTVLGNRFVVDLDAHRKHVERELENPVAGQYRGLKRIQFTGGAWGTSFCFARFPDHDLTAFCLSNSDELSAFGTVRDIVDICLADSLEPLEERSTAEQEVALTPVALRACVGTYRGARGRPIWRVDVREGVLTLTDHLGRSSPWIAVSPSRFRPEGEHPLGDGARLEFKQDSDGGRTLVVSSRDRDFIWDEQYLGVELAVPTPDELQAYSGTYLSRELGSIYRFRVAEGQLQVRLGSRRWEPLVPTVADEFMPARIHPYDQRVISFHRNAEGEVRGMKIAFWRVHGVAFEKIDEQR